MAPVVATASFPLINLPKFYLSFTILVSLILVSLILVKYPDRVGLVNTVPTVPTVRYVGTALAEGTEGIIVQASAGQPS